ncbi:MAG: ABC transporter ATP-binding protein/permease [Polyangiaceae bacterium]|nr:ABC transporter ATP-binding protein/permease [Polyangiaceae bacterium]
MVRPLLQLLRYVRPHAKYAALTISFGIAGFLLSFAYPWLIGSVVDTLAAPDDSLSLEMRRGKLTFFTELAALAAIAHAGVVYGRGHFNVHLGHGVVVDIRRALFEHLQKMSLLFFTKERTGSILSRFLHDVNEATQLVYTGLIVVGLDVVQLAIAVVLLASISPKLTIACLSLFPIYAAVFAVMNPRVQRASERMNGKLTRISGNVAERLAGQALIKTYTAERREAELLGRDVTDHHGLVLAQSREGHLVAAAGEVLVNIGQTIVIGYGSYLALTRAISIGQLTRFLGYVLIMFGPVRRFAELNIVYQTSVSAMRRVFRLLGIQPTVIDPPNPCRITPSRGEVLFENVRFRYSDDSAEARARLDDDSPDAVDDLPKIVQPWVLDGVTFLAKPGQRVAIVGASGAGKSTLLSLLPRLFDVTDGRIVVDGVDVRGYALETLRSSIAIVQQDAFVFTGTIRDNIAYGKPNASDEDVLHASIAAHAHEFISKLEGGYESRIGERGINLSGGQRQRISIARALLKDPRILILDEATSSLDVESEAIVQRALDELMQSRTCFIIAHRLSTVRRADCIHVLGNGCVLESGTHDELLARQGAYARLVQIQTVA